jgi:hypothetical protein
MPLKVLVRPRGDYRFVHVRGDLYERERGPGAGRRRGRGSKHPP